MATFIPPLDLGQFTPSAAAISSWLYQIWKYLQENPIQSGETIQEEITTAVGETVPGAVEDYMEEHPVQSPVTSVNAKVGAVILEYKDLVGDGSTLPIYRASNDEISNEDLLDAWAEGCRFALVDDESPYMMVRNNNTITLLPLSGGGGGGGGSDDAIKSINGTIMPNTSGNAVVTASNLPMSSSDSTTIKNAIDAKTTLAAVINAIYPVGSIYITTGSANPSTLFAGTTWSRIQDKFLLASGSTYTAGATGGEAEHTLTIAEMPSHNHQITFKGSYLNSGTNRRAPDGASTDSTDYTKDTGGGQPHNNMPPYLVVNVWQRTT